MLNRSVIVGPSIIFAIMVGSLLASSSAFPAQRRTVTFVDRLMRANPFRTLANYLGQRLSFEVYHPHRPRNKPIVAPAQVVKMPTWQPIYYAPPVAMIAPFPQAQLTQESMPMPMYGIGYPMPVAMMTQSVSSYKPIVVEHMQEIQGFRMPIPSPPTDHRAPQQMPPPQQYMLPPNTVNNEESDFEDSKQSQNKVKVLVIQPSDMERLKSLSEFSPEMMSGYTTKYIDLEEDAQEESPAQAQVSTPSTHATNDIKVTAQNQTSCVQPMCEQFLTKLIPELLNSSADDDEEVVVTNATILDLNNNPPPAPQKVQKPKQKITGTSSAITVLKAIENPVENFDDQMVSEDLRKPIPLDFTNLSKNVFSSKLNTTNLRKYEPKMRNLNPGSMHDAVHKLTHSHMLKSLFTQQDSGRVISSSALPSNFQTGPALHPPIRPQNTVENELKNLYPYMYGMGNGNSDNRKHKTTTSSAHYTAGVIFNGPKVQAKIRRKM